MLDIQDILRAGDVVRWTIVRTTKKQNVAEHTFNVVMIVRAVAKEVIIDDSVLIKAALEHDLDEVMDGDIPSPTKKRYHIKTKYGGKHKLSDREWWILKMADVMERCWFLEDTYAGRHAYTILTRIREYKQSLARECPHDDIREACFKIYELMTAGGFEDE